MITDLANRALTAVVRVMGEPVTYRRRGQSHEIRGEFQSAHAGLDPETGMRINSTHPVLLIDGLALPFKPGQGDEVEVRGSSYMVRDAQPDGHTGVLLMLQRTTDR